MLQAGGRGEKTLFAHKDRDRSQAMRVSTKFRVNKSVSQALGGGEGVEKE